MGGIGQITDEVSAAPVVEAGGDLDIAARPGGLCDGDQLHLVGIEENDGLFAGIVAVVGGHGEVQRTAADGDAGEDGVVIVEADVGVGAVDEAVDPRFGMSSAGVGDVNLVFQEREGRHAGAGGTAEAVKGDVLLGACVCGETIVSAIIVPLQIVAVAADIADGRGPLVDVERPLVVVVLDAVTEVQGVATDLVTDVFAGVGIFDRIVRSAFIGNDYLVCVAVGVADGIVCHSELFEGRIVAVALAGEEVAVVADEVFAGPVVGGFGDELEGLFGPDGAAHADAEDVAGVLEEFLGNAADGAGIKGFVGLDDDPEGGNGRRGHGEPQLQLAVGDREVLAVEGDDVAGFVRAQAAVFEIQRKAAGDGGAALECQGNLLDGLGGETGREILQRHVAEGHETAPVDRDGSDVGPGVIAVAADAIEKVRGGIEAEDAAIPNGRLCGRKGQRNGMGTGAVAAGGSGWIDGIEPIGGGAALDGVDFEMGGGGCCVQLFGGVDGRAPTAIGREAELDGVAGAPFNGAAGPIGLGGFSLGIGLSGFEVETGSLGEGIRCRGIVEFFALAGDGQGQQREI